MSRYLSQRALKGVTRVGNLMIPGGFGLPSFSQTGCIAYIDEVMETTLPADVKDFNLLMTIISVFPTLFIRGLLRMIETESRYPEPLGGGLRLLNIGIKGVVFSLYYSNKTGLGYQGKRVHDAIGYQVHCQPDVVSHH